MTDSESYNEGYDVGYSDGISKMEYDLECLKEENELMSREVSEFVDSINGYRDTIHDLRNEIEKQNEKISAHRDNLYLFMCEKIDLINSIQELKLELAMIKRKNKDVSIT